MKKEELREVARSIVQIPNDFQLVIEEVYEGENGEGGAMFSWANEEKEEGISIKLDLAGNLTSLSIDMNEEIPDTVPINEEERKGRAEQFLLTFYPDALKDLTCTKNKKLPHGDRFYYEQIVMDIPLERAGCYIDVDHGGNVVRFAYEGLKQAPEIPEVLVSKDKLKEDVKNRLNFNLTIANFYSDLHTVSENGPRLVYELEPLLEYKADVLKPTLTIIYEEEAPETYLPLPPLSDMTGRIDLSMREIIGITEEMEAIREVDMGEEIGIVWRERDWELEEEDLSVSGFFHRQNAETVKAYISKATGKVRDFVWFKERSGDLKLSDEECFQKAVEFLQMMLPDEYPYLHLIVLEYKNVTKEPRKKKPFRFQLLNSYGIPIQSGDVSLAVNRGTGLIDFYGGPSFDIEQLSEVSVKPAVSHKEASEIFLNHLDFELVWEKNYDDENQSYRLIYRACDRHSRKRIRYIDAITGEVISNLDE